MYETLSQHPPDGVSYYPERRGTGPEEYVLYANSQMHTRRVVDSFFRIIGAPRFVPVLGTYDLVHSNRGFFPVGPNRFVIDIEHVSSFVGMDHMRLSRSAGLRNLVQKGLRSDMCGAVLPHSKAAMKTLRLVTADQEVRKKTKVIYPAVIPVATECQHVEGRDSPRLLFMGEYYWKGGREFLEACIDLAHTMDFSVRYISLRVHPPSKVLERVKTALNFEYSEGPIPRPQLLTDIYPSTDIFVMPTYIDTFGYAYVEAMAYSIPCVGTNHFAVPEIVRDGITGLTVDPPLSYFDSSGLGQPNLSIEGLDTSVTVQGLRDALSRLIGSESLRRRLGHEGFKETVQGRFSIPVRNSNLKSVYDAAAKR